MVRNVPIGAHRMRPASDPSDANYDPRAFSASSGAWCPIWRIVSRFYTPDLVKHRADEAATGTAS